MEKKLGMGVIKLTSSNGYSKSNYLNLNYSKSNYLNFSYSKSNYLNHSYSKSNDQNHSYSKIKLPKSDIQNQIT